MIRTARFNRLALAAVTLSAALTLTGCANPVEKMLESTAKSAADSLVSEATGTDIQGIGATEIPGDFPKSVPLPDAVVQSAVSSTDNGEQSWIIHYGEGVNDGVYDKLLGAFAANGFTEESLSDMPGAMRIVQFSNGEYDVNLALLGAADDEPILQILVTTDLGG